jgi:hypothetical protein
MEIMVFPPPPPPVPPPPTPAPKRTSSGSHFLAAAGCIVAFFALGMHRSGSFNLLNLLTAAPDRQVVYQVFGSGEARLTYRNPSGGTEQRQVELPWRLEFTTKPGDFLYLSAQKQETHGTINSLIYVDGGLLQRAETDSPHGIASVSGRSR